MVEPRWSKDVPLTSFDTLDKGLNFSDPRFSNIPTRMTDNCLLEVRNGCARRG